MNETCIVSVAFREPYLTHSKRQEEAIFKGPHWGIDYEACRDELPVKGGLITENIVETFQKSLYGFKPHAIQRAIDAGYKKVIWLDPSVLPTCSIQVLIDALDKYPMITRTGDAPILKMCNQKAKNYFGVTKDNDFILQQYKHIGGTVYGFNFNNEDVVRCFNMWKKAEEDGIFGTQDEFMAGHWADEAVMVLCMYQCSIKQYWEEKFTYLNQKEL